MSANVNKNIVSKSQERIRNKLCKDYKTEKHLEFFTLICVVGYVFMFGIISIINDSVFFSLILSFFSLSTTLSFELTEWANFTNRFKFLQKFTSKNQINIILIGVCIFVIIIMPLCVYSKIDHKHYINLVKKIDTHTPNIITTITFVLYFVSFYIRNYLRNRQIFMSKFIKHS